jgi:methylglutaconyl-CoA hydratase
VPTISAIAGLALHGGLELALSTHLRVFGSTAQVGLPETRLGITPGAGGTHRLPGIIGVTRARDLIITGRRVNGYEASLLGLADRLVEVLPRIVGEKTDIEVSGDGKEFLEVAKINVLSAAIQLAGEICNGSPCTLRAAIRAVDSATEQVENEQYEGLLLTADRDEALNAFVEKRTPLFTGR